MSSEDVAQIQDVAAGSVIGTTGVARKIRGATVAQVASGVFDITIYNGNPQSGNINLAGPDLDQSEGVMWVQPIDDGGDGGFYHTIEHSSDTVKRVTIINSSGGAGGEPDFEFLISRLTNQGGAGDDVVRRQEIAGGMVQIVAGPAISVLKARGCTIARTGVGVYTITLDPSIPGGPELPAADSVSKVNIEDGSTTGLTAILEHTSNTVKTVRIFTDADVVAAADADFSFSISRLLPNS